MRNISIKYSDGSAVTVVQETAARYSVIEYNRMNAISNVRPSVTEGWVEIMLYLASIMDPSSVIVEVEK